MASSGIRQAALGIERLPYGLGRWQVVFRPIEGEDRQTLPQATPTSQGEELAEFGRHAFVPATGDQRNEANDKLCQRELSAAGEVLGAFLGDRLNEVEEKCEQSL